MGKHSPDETRIEWDLNTSSYPEIRSHKAKKEPSDSRAIVLFIVICMGAVAITTNIIASEPLTSSLPSPITASLANPPTLLDSGSETTTDAPDDIRERVPAVSRAGERKTPPVEVAVAYALAQVGKRYVYGASGPNSFDCSGLIMRAFEQIGIKLPHYTGALMGYGRKVGKAELVRGDIIFPSSGHVGIYIGGNQYVHASTPSSGVKISTVYKFYTARRVF